MLKHLKSTQRLFVSFSVQLTSSLLGCFPFQCRLAILEKVTRCDISNLHVYMTIDLGNHSSTTSFSCCESSSPSCSGNGAYSMKIVDSRRFQYSDVTTHCRGSFRVTICTKRRKSIA